MKLIKLLVFTLLIQLSTNAFAQTNNQPKQHKVVIQLNTADTAAWGGVIGNVKNLSKIMFLVVYIINTLQLTEWIIPWNSKEKILVLFVYFI